jgi:hypothetical protein
VTLSILNFIAQDLEQCMRDHPSGMFAQGNAVICYSSSVCNLCLDLPLLDYRSKCLAGHFEGAKQYLYCEKNSGT